jgi:hypothetical protein
VNNRCGEVHLGGLFFVLEGVLYNTKGALFRRESPPNRQKREVENP